MTLEMNLMMISTILMMNRYVSEGRREIKRRGKGEKRRLETARATKKDCERRGGREREKEEREETSLLFFIKHGL